MPIPLAPKGCAMWFCSSNYKDNCSHDRLLNRDLGKDSAPLDTSFANQVGLIGGYKTKKGLIAHLVYHFLLVQSD